jgi:hypothetical protein
VIAPCIDAKKAHLKIHGDEDRNQNHEQHIVTEVLAVLGRGLEIVRINIGDGDDHSWPKESRKLREDPKEAKLGWFFYYPVAAKFEGSVFQRCLGQQHALDGAPPSVRTLPLVVVERGRDGRERQFLLLDLVRCRL